MRSFPNLNKPSSWLLAGILLFAPPLSAEPDRPLVVFFPQGLGALVEPVVAEESRFHYHDNVLTIADDVPSSTLLALVRYYALAVEVGRENLSNTETSRTADGGVYQRQVAGLNTKFETSVDVQDNSPRLVYDPTHPDAISRGPKKGYVEYPAINVRTERAELLANLERYNLVREVLTRRDPTFVSLPLSADNLWREWMWDELHGLRVLQGVQAVNRATDELARPAVSTGKASWRKLSIGMKDNEVRLLLGEPSSVTRYSSTYYVWEYSGSGLPGRVSFDGKGVSSWDEPD